MPQHTKWLATKRLTLSVSQPVGEAWRKAVVNNPDDVMLVQFLLNGIFDTKLAGTGLGGRLALDGVFGRNTHYRLLLVQRQSYQTNTVLDSMDGRVDGLSPGPTPTNTMDNLNWWYFQGNLRIATENDLRAALPPRLRYVLDGGVGIGNVPVQYGAKYT